MVPGDGIEPSRPFRGEHGWDEHKAKIYENTAGSLMPRSRGSQSAALRKRGITIIGGSYALVSSAIGGAAYTAQSVQSATTYYYVVTAVNAQGQESAYSSEVKAVIS